jgi:ligand-binding sensor domain-containing protein/serine phosphatase RsbU (regulator of sigma subunit)
VLNRNVLSRAILLAAAVLLGSVGLAGAQVPPIRQITLPTSLRDVAITSLIQDRIGQVWGATPRGVLLISGTEVTLKTTRDSLSDNNVTALFEDHKGRIWIGHKSGAITRYEDRQFRRFELPEGNPTVEIHSFTEDSYGQIWIGTKGEGLYYASNTRMYLYTADVPEEGVGTLPDNNIYTMLAGTEGDIWAATDAGMARLVATNGKSTNGKHNILTLSQKDGLPDNLVKHLSLDTYAGLVWVTMRDSGVTTFNPTTKKFARMRGFPRMEANATLPVKDGVWIASPDGGVSFWDRRTLQVKRFTSADGLSSNQNLALLLDREGVIWVAGKPGLTQILGDRFQILTSRAARMPSNVTSVFQDRRGELWLGSDSGLTRLSSQSDGSLRTRRYLTGRRSVLVSGVAEDRSGLLWISTQGEGIYRLNPITDRLDQFSMDQGLPERAVACVVLDSTGSIWIGTLGGGVARIEPSAEPRLKIRTFSSSDGLAGDYILSITPSRDRKGIWVATAGNGISRFEAGKWTTIGKAQGLTDLQVLMVQEDAQMNPYALTVETGVFFLSRSAKGFAANHLTTFSDEEGAQPHSLAVDAQGHLVLPDDRRMGVYAPKLKSLLVYDAENGLRDFSPNENAIFTDRYGVIWIGTHTGLVRYNPAALSPSLAAPEVFFTRFEVNQQVTSLVPDTSLSPSQNSLNFYFVAANLSNPQKVFYSYRLGNSSDTTWTPPSRNPFISLPGMRPGEYVLEVRASTQPGIYSAKPARFPFTINPPFYATWWFWPLIIVIVGASGFAYFRDRERRIKEENLRLERKVQERTAEVVRQKDEISEKSEQISLAFKEIEEKNHEITESIQYARRIQQSILPDVHLLRETFADVGVFYRARDIVSGDFYWYAQSAGKTYLAAVDCTGHGVPGAFMSVMAYNLINQTIKDHPGVSPDKFLHYLEESLGEALMLKKDGEAGSQTNDGMDIALIMIDPASQTLGFAGAMRPLYYIRDGELQELRGARFPIGGTQYGEKVFELHTVPIQKGDVYYITSDGLVDQFGGPNGRKFTPTKLKKILLEVKDAPLAEQALKVEQTLEEWMVGFEQLDDLMLVGVRPM